MGLRLTAARTLLATPLALAACGAQAQTTSPGSGASTTHELRMRAGPFEIAPYIRVGEVAIDTNVFYTAEDRRTDLMTSGGPGLRLELPVRRLRLWGDGNVNYYWFKKTVELRTLGGGGGFGADFSAGAFRAGASRTYTRSFDRPSPEVDRRVLQDGWRNRIYLAIQEETGARLTIRPSLNTERTETIDRIPYLGTDLTRTLTQDRYNITLELAYRLTPKTSLLAVGDQEWNRFPKAQGRNSQSNRAGAGFSVSSLSSTRLAVRATGGLRFFRPDDPKAGEKFTAPYVEGQLSWGVGDKTSLTADYRLDTTYSAFDSATGELPTVTTQYVNVWLRRRLTKRIDMNLRGTLTILENNVPVVVRTEEGLKSIERDDRAYTASADLGFEIVRRLRLALMATYSERQSNFADFGVDGLLVGARLGFNP